MDLKYIGEKGVIDRLRALVPHLHPEVVAGIGEDCGVIKIDENTLMLVTTDMLMEGIHFKLDVITPYQLGRRVLSVNLSDIAAMGGWPTYAFLSLGLTDSIAVGFLDELIRGFHSVAKKYEVSLVGGDTISSPRSLVISVVILGKSEAGKVVYRSGAKIGDIVCVTGFLGDAAAGLEMLNRNIDVPADIKDYLLKAHLDPVPPLEIGAALAKSGMIHAMIDVSDGIASDLWHICEESSVGAKLFKELIPISEPCKKLAHILKTSPLEWALRGGEDYKLLFTVPKKHKKKLQDLLDSELGEKFFEVGEIAEGDSVWLINGQKEVNISGKGFDHFATKPGAKGAKSKDP